MVDLKSMGENARIWPEKGRGSRAVHVVGSERESEPRERAREWAWVGEGRCATSILRTGMAGKELDGGSAAPAAAHAETVNSRGFSL